MGATAAVHPADPILQAYGLGKLDDVSSASVSQHLEGCNTCQRRVAELSSDEFLGRIQQAGVMPDRTASGWSPSAGSSTDGTARPIAPPPADTPPPELVDHPDWEIVRELGRGGMGVVYLANNRLMGRPEVLKVVGRHLTERPGVAERFHREIRSAAKLHHTNIVAAHSAIRLGESLVLAMEYVEGLDLAKTVKTKGPLPIAHACYFIHQAALGLQHAHERGMVHRDIKPANLIVASEGKKSVVKVLDFGLAKVTSEGQSDGGLTREGQMLGTPDFIAPEQIRDAQSADIRADIYSLGCTFYYLLTGGPPFHGAHLWDVYQAHFSMEAQPLNLVRPEVPVELAALVAKMMAKEPGRRFQTPGEVAQALMPFFKKGSVGSAASKPDVSQAGQPAVGQGSAGAGLVSTRSGTGLPPSANKPSEKTPPESPLEGLIGLREQEPAFDSLFDRKSVDDGAKQSGQGRHGGGRAFASLSGRRLWAAAMVLLLGLTIALAIVVRLRTPNGVIVLENVPKDAVVEIDGDQVTVTPAAGAPLKIEAQPGRHGVIVKRGNFIVLAESGVTVESGKELKLTVRLETPTATEPIDKYPPGEGTSPKSENIVTDARDAPPAKAPKELPKVKVADSTPTVNKNVRHDGGPAAKNPKPLESIKNSIEMTLNLIPAGKFEMGSRLDDKEAWYTEKPPHNVRITRPFYLGIYEVTQAEYEAVMGTNSISLVSTGQHPVTSISWPNAIRFCNALSAREGITPYYDVHADEVSIPDRSGPGYRLPTETEWEYACRAGTNTKYSFGDDASLMDKYGWHHDNPGGIHPVGQNGTTI